MESMRTSTPPYYGGLQLLGLEPTGYLEDALVEYTTRAKRRRSLLYATTHHDDDHNHQIPKLWNSSGYNRWWVESHNLNCITHNSHTMFSASASDEVGSAESKSRSTEEGGGVMLFHQKEEAAECSPCSNNTRLTTKEDSGSTVPPAAKLIIPSSSERRRKIKGLVYPFAVVKPGGEEGQVTLNDINERMLMPPTRPVHHPVGDYASSCRRRTHAPGLSGKAVVALTTIHTQGRRGTITIIRTKG